MNFPMPAIVFCHGLFDTFQAFSSTSTNPASMSCCLIQQAIFKVPKPATMLSAPLVSLLFSSVVAGHMREELVGPFSTTSIQPPGLVCLRNLVSPVDRATNVTL